jgi:hypothetical protein
MSDVLISREAQIPDNSCEVGDLATARHYLRCYETTTYLFKVVRKCFSIYRCKAIIIDLVIENLEIAINLDAGYREMAKTDVDFDCISHNTQFQALIS